MVPSAVRATDEDSPVTTDFTTAAPVNQAGSDSQSATSQTANDVRLIIERAAHAPEYVYKLVDTLTGDVIVELPREQVIKAAESPNYTSGSVIDTRA